MALVKSQDFNLGVSTSPLMQQLTQAIQSRAKINREDKLMAQKQQAVKIKNDSLRTALEINQIRQMTSNTAKRTAIAKKSQEIIKAGGNPSELSSLLESTNPDELNMGLKRLEIKFGDAGKMFDKMLKDEGAKQQEQFEPVLDKDGNVVAQRNVQTKKVIADPRATARAKASEGKGGEVQSSAILDDGTVQIVYKNGTVEVKQPSEVGQELVRRGKERGVDLQQRRAQGRGLGKDAAKIATKLFDKTGNMRANNRTLRKVISEVEAGAETGALASKLPSLRAASVRLDQVRSELGLDVVGSVTFGALSEGELNLAMSTALPTKLDGPELVKWAQDKIEAQEKLVTYMEDQAIFLSEKGNTPAGWLESQRESRKQAAPTHQQQAAPQPVAPQADENTQALNWAKSNPNDPRAAQILQKLGVQ